MHLRDRKQTNKKIKQSLWAISPREESKTGKDTPLHKAPVLWDFTSPSSKEGPWPRSGPGYCVDASPAPPVRHNSTEMEVVTLMTFTPFTSHPGYIQGPILIF